ncbi:hypothetical protein SPHINGO8AM_120089 [Sphingomonas sp. 8AM]|nr:hypothetical protein SPHINGO8AM_120089 [Sphingomonas sp. 8AM]
MEGAMKQTKTERLTASTAVILGIIADKQALLRSPAAATNVPTLAGFRWRLTKAFYNYRWFIKSALGANIGGGHHDPRIMAVLVAVDDVNAAAQVRAPLEQRRQCGALARLSGGGERHARRDRQRGPPPLRRYRDHPPRGGTGGGAGREGRQLSHRRRLRDRTVAPAIGAAAPAVPPRNAVR